MSSSPIQGLPGAIPLTAAALAAHSSATSDIPAMPPRASAARSDALAAWARTDISASLLMGGLDIRPGHHLDAHAASSVSAWYRGAGHIVRGAYYAAVTAPSRRLYAACVSSLGSTPSSRRRTARQAWN